MSSHKRIRSNTDDLDDDDDIPVDSCNEVNSTSNNGINAKDCASRRNPKKLRENEIESVPVDSIKLVEDDDSCDSDYDDLIDDFGVPNDMDDYLDEVDEDDLVDDDQSTTSSHTTMSTGSVGSNTPSVVGENLESCSIGEGTSEKQKQKNALIGGPLVKNTEPPLRRSLFSNVPPSINFVRHNEVPEAQLPAELRKNLKWKLSTITPAVVKKVATNTGFRLMRKTCSDWGATWGKHMKSHVIAQLNVRKSSLLTRKFFQLFKESIEESMKINHFPGTFNIGRKDRLWKNYQKLRRLYGKEEFGFLPRTFCLPADTKLLKKVWEQRGVKAKWIVKPPAMARGNGIKVVNKWSQVPKCRPLIVQRYIARPHLINNTKYDLRIYVLVTSMHPLKIYLYDDGLVRFASNEYITNNESLGDIFMHLTNYSINKNSASYLPNDDSELRQGHKWTLGSLWQYFAEQGIDQKSVWDRIKDLVIKTIVSAEGKLLSLFRTNICSNYCCYELFGFDVLLDADLKPWLIEVNISPSLHSSSPLDLDVKSPLATEVFNIVRYHVPNKISSQGQRQILKKLNMDDLSGLCLDPRIYTRDLSKADKAKHIRFTSSGQKQEQSGAVDRVGYLDAILEKLTPDDVRSLIRAEDELAQLTHFSRIFPTQETHKYFKFFEEPRYYNLLLDAWESKYGDCRSAGIDRLEQLCIDKVHLKVATSHGASSTFSSKSQLDKSVLKGPTDEVSRTSGPPPQVDSSKNNKAENDGGVASSAHTESVVSKQGESSLNPDESGVDNISTSIVTSPSVSSLPVEEMSLEPVCDNETESPAKQESSSLSAPDTKNDISSS